MWGKYFKDGMLYSLLFYFEPLGGGIPLEMVWRISVKEDLVSYIRNGRELSFRQRMKLVAQLSLPSMAAQLASIIMQYTDAAMVGRLGAGASASIGLVASTTWLFGSLTTSFVSGFSVQVAQYIGARKYERAREVLWQSFFGVLSVALVLSSLGALISRFLPIWLDSDRILWRDAGNYFLVYACALPFMGLSRLSGAMLQCSGNMKVPGMLNSLMCFLDVIFNFLFIFPAGTIVCPVFGTGLPGLGMGVMGAALGTALAQAVTGVAMLLFLLLKTPLLKWEKGKRYGFHKGDWIRAVKISLPVAFEQLAVCGAMVAATRIVAPLGVVAIAANSFAVTAESLCYMPGYGIAEASTTLVGQSIGARREKLALSFGRMTISSGMIFMGVAGALMYFAAPWMIGLLTADAQVRELGAAVLRIEAFAEPLYGASIITTGILRGAGDTLIPSIMNFISLWCVRLTLSYVLARPYGLRGVWVAMCVELCFRGLIFLVRFLRKRWINYSSH